MSDNPTIKAVAEAISQTETGHNNHTFLPDAKDLAISSIRAFFQSGEMVEMRTAMEGAIHISIANLIGKYGKQADACKEWLMFKRKFRECLAKLDALEKELK